MLEKLKSLSMECFNLTLNHYNMKTQSEILNKYYYYLNNLHLFCENMLSSKSKEIFQQFLDVLKEKIDDLSEILEIDKKYLNTLPSELKQ